MLQTATQFQALIQDEKKLRAEVLGGCEMAMGPAWRMLPSSLFDDDDGCSDDEQQG